MWKKRPSSGPAFLVKELSGNLDYLHADDYQEPLPPVSAMWLQLHGTAYSQLIYDPPSFKEYVL